MEKTSVIRPDLTSPGAYLISSLCTMSWSSVTSGKWPSWSVSKCSRSWRHRSQKPRVRPCEPLCGLLRGGAASLCPGEGFRASFGRIFVDFPGSAEDEGRGRIKISKPGRELRFFCWRDHLSGTVQIRTVGRERSAATISVSPFRLAIPPKMRHNSPWKECALYAA